MSHDPQSPTDAADFFDDDDEPDMLCTDCGDGIWAEDVNVEAYERFAAVLCRDCFDERCADEGDEGDPTDMVPL